VEKFAFEIMASGKIEVDAGLLMKALAERPKQFIVIHVPDADKCNVMVDDDDKLTRTGLLAGMVGARREALFVPNRANATSKSHVVADSEVLQPLGMMATIEDHLESLENFIKGIADKYAGLLEDLNAKTKDAYGVIKAEQEKEKDDDSYVEKLKESAEDADKDYDEKDNKQHSPLGNGGTSDAYTWTQTLSTLEAHVPVEPGVKAKQIVCDIGVGTLKVGIKGEPLILQGEMYGKVKPDDCMWTLLDNKILQISLEKLDSRKWWRHFMQGDLAHDVSDVADGIDTINDLVNDSMAYFIGDDADEEAKHDADHKESSFSEESSRCDESDDDVYDDEEEEHNYHDYIMDDIEREQWDQEFAEHAKLVQVNLVAP